jgi:undecaprenyl-diphosphatase
MNDFLLAAILGVVEGITEFLPVSSTAHLRIAQHYLGLSLEDEYWKLFAVFIQLGAILAVVVLYRQRLQSFFREAFRAEFFRQPVAKTLGHPLGLIGLAFVCTALPAFLLKKLIGKNLESLTIMAAALVVGGVVMIAVDFLFGRGKVTKVEEMKPWQAIFIGIVQLTSAVFPGTSRSMSTIAAGQLLGLNRSAALDFSFFVSIPIMIVATLYDLFKYWKESGAVGISLHQSAVLAVGFFVSFVVAYVVVAWFLNYVKTKGFLWFGIYRIAIGAFLFYSLAQS